MSYKRPSTSIDSGPSVKGSKCSHTYYMVVDVFKNHVEAEKLIWPEGIEPLAHLPLPEVQTMRLMQRKFHRTHCNVFDQNSQPIVSDNAHAHFLEVISNLFKDGIITWGGIIAAFHFGAELALKHIECGQSDMVPLVIGWLTNYIEKHILCWIEHQGGWSEFCSYFWRQTALCG